MAEKYTLNWHTFSEHLQVMFKDLYQEGRYTDVTLVSDDQTQFKAHKIVLSACSPVFKKIIDSNPSQHPLIYLRGVQSYEVESILQFMYLGEGRFYHERMGEFIKVAQDLEVKEISDGVEMGSGEEETLEEDITREESEETFEEETKHHENKTKLRPRQPRTQISNDAKSTQCPECGAVYTQRQQMLLHYRSKHEGVKYPCKQCDYQATTQSKLQTHIQSQHEGIRYPCNQCDYQATQQSHLQAHISAKHSDTVLKCEDCDYQTKWRSRYNKHKKTHRALRN